MTKRVDFSGPYLKIERAGHHINDLKEVFTRYTTINKDVMLPNDNSEAIEFALPRRGSFPKHTSTILGDALHNLRAALDHAYCALVEANGHSVNNFSAFPIVKPGGTWQKRKVMMEGDQGKGNGIGVRMIEVFDNEVQPYEAGQGADLVKLHVLDIADKHMTLLPTLQRTDVEDVRFLGGGGISGITFMTTGNIVAVKSDAPFDPNHINKVSFEVCFGEGQPFAGEPIIPTLEVLARRVHEILRLLEHRARDTL